MNPTRRRFLVSRWPSVVVLLLALPLFAWLVHASAGMTSTARQPRLGVGAGAFENRFGKPYRPNFSLPGNEPIPLARFPNETFASYRGTNLHVEVTFWRGSAAKIEIAKTDASKPWSPDEIHRHLEETGFRDDDRIGTGKYEAWLSADGNRGFWKEIAVFDPATQSFKVSGDTRMLVFETPEYAEAFAALHRKNFGGPRFWADIPRRHWPHDAR